MHLIDITPINASDPIIAAKAIIEELAKFSSELANKERWLVFNKIDMLSQQEVELRSSKIIKQLKWKGPMFKISALKKQGTQKLCYALMDRLSPVSQ